MEVSSLFVDLLFPHLFDLVTNDNFSDNEDILDVDLLPGFMLVVFSKTSE